jgi:hypothetical protein
MGRSEKAESGMTPDGDDSSRRAFPFDKMCKIGKKEYTIFVTLNYLPL